MVRFLQFCIHRTDAAGIERVCAGRRVRARADGMETCDMHVLGPKSPRNLGTSWVVP
eukprot:COSAG02_NODE_3314_length_6953_cov_4.605924_1_plen_57_part_00